MDRNLRKPMDSRLEKENFGANAFEIHEEELTISKIALGMAYLNSRGFMHRDLKPTNLLAQEQSNDIIEVKIVDFGLSHLVEFSSESSDTSALERLIIFKGWLLASTEHQKCCQALLILPKIFPALELLDKTSKMKPTDVHKCPEHFPPKPKWHQLKSLVE